MHIAYRSAPIAISMISAFALAACQPTAEDTSAAAEPSEVTNPETIDVDSVDPHTEHEMAENDTITGDAQMSDILKDYTKSMTSMHAEMMVGMKYNDPDTAFAKGMLGHHRGAVDMANIEQKYGKDPEMLKLAQQIIDAQQIEIDIMNKWLASHPDSAKPKPDTEAMQQAYAVGMDEMHEAMTLGIADPIADMAFARGMLPHHIGAVAMAKVQLKYGKDTEMRKLAQQIIDEQQPEIEQMQQWIAMYSTDEMIQDELEEMAENN